jgi:flagellar biosynthetic protein FliR
VLTVDIAQLQHWLGLALWPFLRIGACVMVAPVFGGSYVPRRLRVVFAGALTLVVLPLLPASAAAAPLLSADGVLVTVQQVLIGVVLGFALQLVFDALALGGQLLANGMGLGFAFNLDPLRGVQTPALGQLYVVLGTLTFLALDGHLAVIELLLDSFRGLPVGSAGLGPEDFQRLALWGSTLFAGALKIALPGMTALLVINLAFGAMSRAAPALNLFAVGLPVTLVFGLAIVLAGLPLMQSGLIDLLTQSFGLLRTLTAGP